MNLNQKTFNINQVLDARQGAVSEVLQFFAVLGAQTPVGFVGQEGGGTEIYERLCRRLPACGMDQILTSDGFMVDQILHYLCGAISPSAEESGS